ncbi:hypothetical protein GCM10018781_61150 [Kitasatospora indigofera]|uniref:Uncharacterized protein n=1 Tax=Kitasatospora indigofera TaxID=67307 RepID=A0A919L221_9ACTN|nr:hypothetical protein [Kitasatospora indigofera]GHH80499.1 hypothetical protein GCM10018781_61150 [Kitasatospora indigofera]
MPDLTPVIAACTRWLLNAYPPPAGALSRALAEAQARQAATLAAVLRHPTALDVQLLDLLGPGGADRLDHLTGHDPHPDDSAWRTWVDETVVSWAACLLAEPALAAHALATTEHHTETGALHRLTHPNTHDTQATPLLRHPDLLGPVASLHRTSLMERLAVEGAEMA